MKTPKRKHRAARRSGKVVVLLAVMLPFVLIPILALGVDGALLMQHRRRLQAAVDAAALTAAAQLYRDNTNHNLTSQLLPNSSGAYAAAMECLDTHDFPAGRCSQRTVNMPANSANPRIDGMPGTIEVVVTYQQSRGFSALLGSSDLGVTARAVARVRNFSQGNGIIILEETDNRALYGRGNGTLLVNEGGVVVNSTGPQAAETNGSNTVLAATSFDVTGGYYGDRFFRTPYPSAGSTTPYTGSVPVPDPLRDLAAPSPGAYPVQPTPSNSGPSGTPIVLQPGRYTSRIVFDGPRTIILEPGIYYLERGISLQGQATLSGAGVMIYNAGSGGDNIDLGGLGQWSLTPPTSGPYEGVSVFQSRHTASRETTAILRGNGGSGVLGTIYAPTTKVRITGNGYQTLGSQFIARTLEMDGEGHFTVNFAAAKAPQPPVLELME